MKKGARKHSEKLGPFVAHVANFIERMELTSPHGTLYVAVSGGMDSMALLAVLAQWSKNCGLPGKLKAIHINHGSRPAENSLEECLVTSWCEKWEIPLIIKKLELSSTTTNFEHHARQQRYAAFRELLEREDRLATAHHIDDSFEWSLLTQFKSGSGRGVLGIPVVTGQYVRPFMCVTRNHIRRFARDWDVPFFDDPTNALESYERNYLRHKVIPHLQEKFPRYLKHYVHRSENLAQQLGLSRRQQLTKREERGEISLYHDMGGGTLVVNWRDFGQFELFRQEIRQLIEAHSSSERGVLGLQLDKLQALSQSGKEGPLTFSGGVEVYHDHGVFYILDQKSRQQFEEMDQRLLGWLKEQKATQIPDVDINLEKSVFPYLMFKFPQKMAKRRHRKRIHPLFPLTTKWAMDNGIEFQTFFRLKKDQKAKIKMFFPPWELLL